MSDRRRKLTEKQVAEIRKQRADGRKAKDIRIEFGISYTALWKIVNERTWKKSITI